jgi:hypothetical protein
MVSHLSKLVYGRLTQWASSCGSVFRSSKQLAIEVGSNISSIERSLKELRDIGLIGTHQPQSGGVNHFEFYEHEWMSASIAKELSYENANPPSEVTAPPVRSDGTPPSEVTDININKYKQTKQKEIYKEKVSSGMKPIEYKDTYFLQETVIEKTFDNPHDIDNEAFNSWLQIRKKKNCPVTPRVWALLNKELSKCPNPKEAFDLMILRGWTSVKKEWVVNASKDSAKAPEGPYYDNDSFSRINRPGRLF